MIAMYPMIAHIKLIIYYVSQNCPQSCTGGHLWLLLHLAKLTAGTVLGLRLERGDTAIEEDGPAYTCQILLKRNMQAIMI